MKTIIQIFSIVLAFFFTIFSPTARATCQQGCDTSNFNTFLGDDALAGNTSGANNTAVGFEALSSNTTGLYNTAVGSVTLQNNTVGYQNTAVGVATLTTNGTGFSNTATGYTALRDNTTGFGNTASGFEALLINTDGQGNTATGSDALHGNTTGSLNTALGNATLYSNTTGTSNIAVGASAGTNLTTGSDNIDIGNSGVGGEFRTIRIGTKPTHKNTFIAGISGATVPTGVPVIVDVNGHLGTTISSARFKEAIEPMDRASEAILALKPVTFRYKKELDPDRIEQFGLVAEEVERVNPDLVARDEQGKPYTVRYEAVNAMLLNEFLKQHRKVEQQRKDFEAALAQQQKQIEALTAGLQKVSAQLELNKSEPQTVSR